MSRYRKIEVRTWSDEKFRALSPVQPSGQGLWFFLLTGPHTGPIPGLFRAGRAAMAEELGWRLEAFDEAFREVSEQGMAKADFVARLMWLPNAIKHNKPESPNVVKSWAPEFDLLPECPLKLEALEAIKAFVCALGPGFSSAFVGAFESQGKPFGKASRKPSGKTMPNQEQEQEQEQEIKAMAAEPPVSSKAADPCPHQAIIDLYHQILPASPEVKAWNDTRKAKLRARWKEDPRRQSVEWWSKFFNYIAESDFLTGKTCTQGRKPFTPNLEWIVTPANFVKIIEGTYHEGGRSMNAPDLRNLPPHSLEAEHGLLGAILCDGDRVLDRIEGAVSAGDFYRADHRAIFTAAKALHDARKAVDVLTVAEALAARGEAEQTGGLAYLGELANVGFMAANARQYAATIREKATLRGLQQIAADALAACANPAGRGPADIAAEAEAGMLALLDHSDTEPARLQDLLCDVMADVDQRSERGGKLAGLATGFTRFDEMTGGLEPGQLVIVAARPSVGKTVAGCNIATHAALSRVPVLFFTLEMGRQEIAARILAARSGVTVQAMRAGTRERDDWDRMNEATGAAAAWRLFIDDTPACTVAYVRAKARRIQRAHGLGLLVIDYLGLMRGAGDNRAQEVGSISRGLKALAKELQVPVIALAQLNRASEGRPDRKPTLADLRDSGEIEQDADIVAMLHREDMHRTAPEWAGLAQLLIRKNRNGPTGECLLALDGPRMRFTDYDGPHPSSAASEAAKPKQRKGFDA